MSRLSPLRMLALCIVFLLPACASHKARYVSELDKGTPPPSEKVAHSLFLIGDAGTHSDINDNPTLLALRRELTQAGENSSVIFLGNNIFPNGFPHDSKQEGKRQDAIAKLDAQLRALEGFEGMPYFLPGHRDWKANGVLSVRDQEDYIEQQLNQDIDNERNWKNHFLPDNGCGGPHAVEVNDKLVIIFVDSNWHLKDWDKEHASLNEGCPTLSRAVFRYLFEDLCRKHRSKNIVVAMHHPLYTYGPHGGRYSAKQHFLPLTHFNEKLKIPLPLVGTMGALARRSLGTRQDVAHQAYRDLRTDLLQGAEKGGGCIFVAGHEHNLQYIERNGQQFVVSGAGGKESPAAMGRGSQFAYGRGGFAKIDFYEDGSAWLSFFSTEKKEWIFIRKIREQLAISEENIPEDFPEYEAAADSVLHSPTLMDIRPTGKLHDLLLGEHYRDLYLQKYGFPVLRLEDFEGGAYPVKRGGGSQTNSLRLKTKDGRQYVMRALTKDASRLLPYPLNKMTLANSLAEESFLSTHPFAPLVIPKLADAAQVHHTNPKLYYIPKQPALGVHNDLFGGDVYLVEERPSTGHEGEASFGVDAEKFHSTPDVIANISRSHLHRVDQAWTLRSRLFDLLLGDWDRHDDQWRWQRHHEGELTVYRPIPRDRDQAFSKYDGFVSSMTRGFMPFMQQIKPYDGKIKDKTKWENWGARFFDHTFLNEITWEDWEREALFLQEQLTDEVIDEAFMEMPAYARGASAEEIKEKLRQRRDDIVKYARQFYVFFSKEITVRGTEGAERFEVTRREGGETLVEVFHGKEKTYSRIFDKKTTKEIHIYGLGGDDVFHLRGTVGKGSMIRIVGGLGDDKIHDESHVYGPSKKTRVYDSKGGAEMDLGKEGRGRMTRHKDLNYYDRNHTHFEYDFSNKSLFLGYNNDDGFILGATYGAVRYKFKKVPYAQRHYAMGLYAINTRAGEVEYSGEFMQAIDRWDITLDFDLHGPRNTFNYFGFGNRTARNQENRAFNEVRMSQGIVDVGFRKRFAKNSGYLKFHPTIEWVSVQPTEERLVTAANNGLPDDIFDYKFHLGGGVEFGFKNLDNYVNPTEGIRVLSSYSWRWETTNLPDNFSNFRTSATGYLPVGKRQRATIVGRMNFGMNFGGRYQFYHGNAIGGDFLRGYRNERFLGDRAFSQNTDLRVEVVSSNNKILPFSIGLHGGFDYGRVWLNNTDESRKIHYGYGGGFWVSPANFAIVSLGYYRSADDARFSVKLGHLF